MLELASNGVGPLWQRCGGNYVVISLEDALNCALLVKRFLVFIFSPFYFLSLRNRDMESKLHLQSGRQPLSSKLTEGNGEEAEKLCTIIA